ncbi:MAG: hypothetical protein ABSC94_14240 [Polyangiaceae bacterium]
MIAPIERSGMACPAGELALVGHGVHSCVPVDAACPRLSSRRGRTCVSGPRCPPGSLPDGGACRPIVLEPKGDRPRVDVGAWAVLSLGYDGGPGSAALCRPLELWPLEIDSAEPPGRTVRLRIVITFTDEDVSGLHAVVTAVDESGRPLPPNGAALAEGAVDTMVELLRALGGQSSAASLNLDVRCALSVEPRSD